MPDSRVSNGGTWGEIKSGSNIGKTDDVLSVILGLQQLSAAERQLWQAKVAVRRSILDFN